jgi:hypothetical protein
MYQIDDEEGCNNISTVRELITVLFESNVSLEKSYIHGKY